jgi:teichuronic acid biosynthesis glycosyltransferase TuaG
MGALTTVSVIIATWNRAITLERAVRSALSQTYPPLEVLVCDDGSTDETEQIVRSIGDDRVIWLPGDRAGRPAIPRNRGIFASRGEWLAFLDDDDIWLPQKLKLQMERLQVSGSLASCTDAYRIVPDKGNQGMLLGLETDILRFKDVLDVNRVICSSVVTSSIMVKMAGGFPETSSLVVGEDFALWLRLMTMTDFDFIALPLLEYFDNPQHSIRRNGPHFLVQKQEVIDDFCTWAEFRGRSYFAMASEFKGRSKVRISVRRVLSDLVRGALRKS